MQKNFNKDNTLVHGNPYPLSLSMDTCLLDQTGDHHRDHRQDGPIFLMISTHSFSWLLNLKMRHHQQTPPRRVK